MKNLYYLIALLLCASCEAFLGGDINADPNHPTTVPVTSQIPTIQLALVDLYGGEYSRWTSVLTQQVEGVARCCTSPSFGYSGLIPSRFTGLWDTLYVQVLNEIYLAKQGAEEQGLAHHLGMLQVLEAFALMIATDVWDNIPYSQAFKGVEISDPAYDEQRVIYPQIFSLLDNGIALLEGSPGSLGIGEEDIYLRGDIDKWLKAAYAIKARGRLHFDDYAGTLAAAQRSYTDRSESLGFQYPGGQAAANWYRFNRDRTGDLAFHPFMRTVLQTRHDTFRLAQFDQPFYTNHPYLTADLFFELISYREVQFILAEVDVRSTPGGTELGYNAFLNGIRASFEKAGLAETDFQTYISQTNFPNLGQLSLEEVMIEKYLALFLQPEVYSDYRRTGFPKLIPASGSTIPVRWPYSANEHAFNANAPKANEIDVFTDRVGWNRK